MPYQKTRKARGGQRTGLMNPRWGGKAKPEEEDGVGTLFDVIDVVNGGGNSCGCRPVPPVHTPMGGGYRATKRDLKYLKLWKQGKSIGFTMRSSLKAKGLIPRANGTKRVSAKYRK
jgi:hypothetical protein